MNKFKEFRRAPKRKGPNNNNDQQKQAKLEKPKCPGDTVEVIMKPPTIPSGEDETSFERHKKVATYTIIISHICACMHACMLIKTIMYYL